MIGFSFTQNSKDTNKYLDAIRLLVVKEKFAGRPIIVFVRNFQDIDKNNLPRNVILVPFSNLSLALLESIIAHADLPILVSGDTVLSLALEYEKPYFHEPGMARLQHRHGIAQILRDFLEKDLLGKRWIDSEIDSSGGIFDPALALPLLMADVAGSDKFAEQFKMAIQYSRRTLALTDRIKRYLSYFDLFTAHELQNQGVLIDLINVAHGHVPENAEVLRRVFPVNCATYVQ